MLGFSDKVLMSDRQSDPFGKFRHDLSDVGPDFIRSQHCRDPLCLAMLCKSSRLPNIMYNVKGLLLIELKNLFCN